MLISFADRGVATCHGARMHSMITSLEPGSPLTLYRITNKKGESLEDFDHVLDMVDMVGRGLQDQTSIEQC